MDQYIADACRTESNVFPLCEHKFPENESDRLLHAAMGLCTEAGEFMDALKKHLFYKNELDEVNLHEELGDILWYVAIAADALDIDFTTIQQINIAKLRARFPDKYSHENANTRDLDNERSILEQ